MSQYGEVRRWWGPFRAAGLTGKGALPLTLAYIPPIVMLLSAIRSDLMPVLCP